MNKLLKTNFLIGIIILSVLVGIGCKSDDRSLESVWNEIRSDPDKLETFIQQLPKGGDLHHHLLGSVYAETFLQIALEQNMWIDTVSFQLHSDSSGSGIVPVFRAGALVSDFENRLINTWSVRNLDTTKTSGHDHFFSTFFKFQPAFVGNELRSLEEVIGRAHQNGLVYIETSFLHWAVQDNLTGLAVDLKEEEVIDSNILDHWVDSLEKFGIRTITDNSVRFYDSLGQAIEDQAVTVGFQTYANRCFPSQALVFTQLLHGFQVASQSESVVGINFVAPEDNAIALKNFDNHMAMFQFLKEMYPDVHVSLHAGELVPELGDVEPEDLNDHIKKSIELAGAERIGHGVDIRHEERTGEIVDLILKRNICLELNLESNQVILGTDRTNHPIHLYRKNNIPFVISTDDEGVLRSNISEQYKLLFHYLPDLKFRELKTLVFNSIDYSFLPAEKKKVVRDQLSNDFLKFEQSLLN
jgi:hypothetical protein